MRKYHHSEMCEWKVDDPRCTWRNYSTGTEACDVIERSPFDSFHFVGDSLIRNMFYALLMILTDDPVGGAWSRKMADKLKSYCRAEKFFFFKCKGVVRSLDELKNPEKLCGGKKVNFSINAMISYGNDLQKPFMELGNKLRGQKGTLILLHVGLHMNMDANSVIKNYLEPAVAIRESFYKTSNVSGPTKWPQIYFVPPLLSGLLKPTKFLPTQGKTKAAIFADKIQEFCLKNNVTFFDVRPFSKLVHSFDGTHYGLGVNLMKNQLLLNHFEELTRQKLL